MAQTPACACRSPAECTPCTQMLWHGRDWPGESHSACLSFWKCLEGLEQNSANGMGWNRGEGGRCLHKLANFEGTWPTPQKHQAHLPYTCFPLNPITKATSLSQAAEWEGETAQHLNPGPQRRFPQTHMHEMPTDPQRSQAPQCHLCSKTPPKRA